MKKMKIALIVIAFIVVSVGLTWAWDEWARGLYAKFFRAVAVPLYDAIGLEHAQIAPSRQRYINFVPFIALVLVTPGLELRRRIIGLILGLVTISASHFVLNLTAIIQPGPALPIVASLLSDSFPFLVWFFVAYPVLVGLIPDQPTSDDSEDSPEG